MEEAEIMLESGATHALNGHLRARACAKKAALAWCGDVCEGKVLADLVVIGVAAAAAAEAAAERRPEVRRRPLQANLGRVVIAHLLASAEAARPMQNGQRLKCDLRWDLLRGKQPRGHGRFRCVDWSGALTKEQEQQGLRELEEKRLFQRERCARRIVLILGKSAKCRLKMIGHSATRAQTRSTSGGSPDRP
eukprot:5267452-Pleurochrysis_carterae.AAC.2